MSVQEHIPLAPFTTLGVGGTARFFIEATTERDVRDAITFARERACPLFVLGNGSNVLVPDGEIPGVVLRMAMRDIRTNDVGEHIELIADAGALWDDVVDAAGTRGVFGIANLAGIPGSVGGAAVQNIGAYGAELSETFDYADCIDAATGTALRINRAHADFAYRTSKFKKERTAVITRIALRLAKDAQPNLAYADVARLQGEGASLSTPREIATAIRAIRARKFPAVKNEGTAGSFFKNPVLPRAAAQALTERFPGLPTFPQRDGTVKIPLAWLLDHVLALKGYARGPVRLFENQPLVIVAGHGATAADIDGIAHDVATRVQDLIGIRIEREVETFGGAHVNSA